MIEQRNGAIEFIAGRCFRDGFLRRRWETRSACQIVPLSNPKADIPRHRLKLISAIPLFLVRGDFAPMRLATVGLHRLPQCRKDTPLVFRLVEADLA